MSRTKPGNRGIQGKWHILFGGTCGRTNTRKFRRKQARGDEWYKVKLQGWAVLASVGPSRAYTSFLWGTQQMTTVPMA